MAISLPLATMPEESSHSDHDVTALLLAWGAGDASAAEALLPLVYEEMRRQAGRAMRREDQAHTLQPTALVHEAYLRLVDQRRATWKNRAQFLGVSAQMMRRVLVDHARGRLADKRGGGAIPVTLANANEPQDHGASAIDVLALHDALEALERFDPDQARIVELRYFGGMTIEETAEAVGSSPATVKREWATARAWLRREMLGG